MKYNNLLILRSILVNSIMTLSLVLGFQSSLFAEGYDYDANPSEKLISLKIKNKTFYADIREARVTSHTSFLILIIYDSLPKTSRGLYDSQEISYFHPGTASFYPDGDSSKKKEIYLDQDIEYCADDDHDKPCEIPKFRQVLLKQQSDTAVIAVKDDLLSIITENYGSEEIEVEPEKKYFYWEWDGTKFVELVKRRKKIVHPFEK